MKENILAYFSHFTMREKLKITSYLCIHSHINQIRGFQINKSKIQIPTAIIFISTISSYL